MPLPRLQAYHLAVADTLERVYGNAAQQHADEIGYHLYQAGTAADPSRTARFLAQAAKNALTVGAFEEVQRLIDTALLLLPADQTRERADALAARGHALWGLGRIDDARAAWRGAVQRYEELDDTKAVMSVHALLAHLEARNEPEDESGEPAAAEPEAAAAEPEAEPVES
jgi:ATP/maltotriose-dependent transcriptional regulator MalT